MTDFYRGRRFKTSGTGRSLWNPAERSDDFKLGDVFQDSLILKQAAKAAGELLRTDPRLKSERNRRLADRLKHYLSDVMLEMTL